MLSVENPATDKHIPRGSLYVIFQKAKVNFGDRNQQRLPGEGGDSGRGQFWGVAATCVIVTVESVTVFTRPHNESQQCVVC